MKRLALWLVLCCIAGLAQPSAFAQYVTLTGTLSGSNGVKAQNYTISFTPTQWFYVAGTATFIGTTNTCATTVDGTVVGVGNPLEPVTVTPGFGGTLPAGTYYVEYTFYTATTETLPSPEMVVQLTSTGQLTIAAPAAGVPTTALGMRVYIGTASGAEQEQGETVGNNVYQQQIPLGTNFPPPSTNTTLCQQVANDAGWPTGTGYKVSVTDSSGNVVPGYPTLWQLLGPNTTINLSSGLPQYNGVVLFPAPILASPYNHNTQSISGNLGLSNYKLLNVAAIGVGTSLPVWSVDVENGYINTNLGYLVAGHAGTLGQCLVSNGNFFGPGSCGTLPTIYNQFVAANGTLLPQESILDFQPRLTVANNGFANWNYVDLAASGVTPGTYTNPNITVDTYGRVTAAANGSSPTHIVQPLVITSGICTTGTGAYQVCSFTVTWPTAWANNSYALTCSAASLPMGSSAILSGGPFISNKTTTTFELSLINGGTSGAEGATTVNEIDCIGVY